MEWQKPEFTEIEMNAEIGAYQQDPGEGGDPDRIVPAATGPGVAHEPAEERGNARQ